MSAGRGPSLGTIELIFAGLMMAGALIAWTLQ
jgi:hypothetical protein